MNDDTHAHAAPRGGRVTPTHPLDADTRPRRGYVERLRSEGAPASLLAALEAHGFRGEPAAGPATPPHMKAVSRPVTGPPRVSPEYRRTLHQLGYGMSTPRTPRWAPLLRWFRTARRPR